MKVVSMLQAKSALSRLVEAIEQGREHEITIARRGRPVARLVPLEKGPAGKRIGVAKGAFEIRDAATVHNESAPHHGFMHAETN